MNKVYYLGTEEIMPLIKESLHIGQKVAVTVTGTSMYPLFIHERDSVVLEKAIVYKPKDIVLYLREDGSPVLHRIIAKREEGYAMCGDHQDVEEYPIKESAILGRVCEFERKGKKMSVENPIYKLYSFIWGMGLKHRKTLLFPILRVVGLFKK